MEFIHNVAYIHIELLTAICKESLSAEIIWFARGICIVIIAKLCCEASKWKPRFLWEYLLDFAARKAGNFALPRFLCLNSALNRFHPGEIVYAVTLPIAANVVAWMEFPAWLLQSSSAHRQRYICICCLASSPWVWRFLVDVVEGMMKGDDGFSKIFNNWWLVPHLIVAGKC